MMRNGYINVSMHDLTSKIFFRMPVIQTTDLNAFIDLITNSDIPHPVYFEQAPGAPLRGRSTFSSYNPPRYGLADIPVLQRGLYFFYGSDKPLENSTLRYVIDSDASHTPYFSPEGSEKHNVSAHERLSSACLAAGMLRFEEYNGHIVLAGIDHNSGYFKPEVDCLIWPLKMLLSTKVFQLSSTLQLHCRIQGVATCFTLDTNALLDRVNMLMPSVSSFAQQQSASDSYEMLRERIQQQAAAVSLAQQNESIHNRQLLCHSVEAVSLNERSESVEPPAKRKKQTTMQTEEQSLCLVRMARLKFSLKQIGFSKTSAFSIWQPGKSRSLAKPMPPSPTP